LQPYIRTFCVCLLATVPDGICWLTPLSFKRILNARLCAGFVNHGLTCLAINFMIACAIGGVYLSFGNFVVVKAVAYCRRLLLRHELVLSVRCCFPGRLDYAAAFNA
jgi:hypothetical protein